MSLYTDYQDRTNRDRLADYLIERITLCIWPQAPRDYSLATVEARWKLIEPVYQAQRIKEYQANKTRNAQ